MKTLSMEEMENAEGGGISLLEGAGFMCATAALLLCSGVFAPIAIAPAIGCGASLAFHASL